MKGRKLKGGVNAIRNSIKKNNFLQILKEIKNIIKIREWNFY